MIFTTKAGAVGTERVEAKIPLLSCCAQSSPRNKKCPPNVYSAGLRSADLWSSSMSTHWNPYPCCVHFPPDCSADPQSILTLNSSPASACPSVITWVRRKIKFFRIRKSVSETWLKALTPRSLGLREVTYLLRPIAYLICGTAIEPSAPRQVGRKQLDLSFTLTSWGLAGAHGA